MSNLVNAAGVSKEELAHVALIAIKYCLLGLRPLISRVMPQARKRDGDGR